MAKKILYVYGGFYSPNGMSMMISQKVNYLAENTDNQIYIVLTEHPEKDSIYKLSDKVHVKWLVVNFDDLDTLPLYKKIPCYFIKQWKYKRLLSRYMMELRPDITVSIARREINFINKIKDGSKKIAEIHFARTFYRKFDKKIFPSFVNEWISRKWMNSLIRNLKLLDRFVVLTDEDSYNWSELTNVMVIPNFVSSIPTQKSSCKNKKVIAAGRYSEQKGFDLLIKAWEHVSHIHPDWALEIYGAGDNIAYQSLADSLNLSSVVHCNSAVSDIYEKYAESAFFVLSSRYEGFCLVILEAMGAGLPVVSFTCPCGPRDVIDNGKNGYLVVNGSIKDMADKICYMIEHEDERIKMGKMAIQYSAKYNKDAIMKRWIELFETL